MALAPPALIAVLQPAILTQLQTTFAADLAQDSSGLVAAEQVKLSTALATGIANALIPYLIASTQVLTVVAVSPHPPGGAAAGTGTGTIL